MLGWDTWTTLHKLISLVKRRKNKEVDTTICFYLRSVDEDRQAPPSATRPAYQEAKTASVKMQRQSRQDLGIPFIPKSEWRRFNDQLNPSLRRNLEWPSTNWAECFTEERELPTSSSSSQWSSTSLWSTHSWSSNWKGWQQQSWQDHKWSDQRWPMDGLMKSKSSPRKLVAVDFKKVILDKYHKIWPPSRLSFF